MEMVVHSVHKLTHFHAHPCKHVQTSPCELCTVKTKSHVHLKFFGLLYRNVCTFHYFTNKTKFIILLLLLLNICFLFHISVLKGKQKPDDKQK